tara:strand:- start:744 stop:2981 length:2238 start_codon:yes stop_codon:yes gene_type:complete
MLEQRLSKIDFIGRDGFQWFIAQVTTDKNWREYSLENGYRAKIRILGHHPTDNTIPDEELPWAHFLVPPNMGAGNNHGGMSFALQGGETVIGFFLDGEDAQQPVVFGAFSAGTHIDKPIPFKQVNVERSSGLLPIGVDQAIEFGKHILPTGNNKPNSRGGLSDHNKKIFGELSEKLEDLAGGAETAVNNLNTVIEEQGPQIFKQLETMVEKLNNEEIIIKKAQKITIPKNVLSDATKAMSTFTKKMQNLEPIGIGKDAGGFIDKVFNIKIPKEEFDISLKKVAKEISGAVSVNMRVAKVEMLKEINNAVDSKLDFLDPSFLMKKLKIEDKNSDFHCAVENILGGLDNTISDLLKQTIGKAVSIPICVAESMLAGVISDLTEKINTKTSAPLADIKGIAGGIELPDFSSMVDKALNLAAIGEKLFTCEGDVPFNPADIIANVGLDKLKVPDIGRMKEIAAAMKKTDLGLLQSIFPGIDGLNPFEGLSDIAEGLGTTAQQKFLEMDIANELGALGPLVSGCSGASGAFGKKCGPPSVTFFGGEGIGGFGKAVINETGKIIGVSMEDLGSGFTSPPLVTFNDPCENGAGASGKAVIKDGQIVKVIMQESGGGYLGGAVGNISNVDGATQSSSQSITNQISTTEGEQVIAVLDGIDIINTGVGYEEGDTITTDDGQVLEPVIQNGRIVDANPIDVIDGITDLPKLTINTSTGFGAIIRPTLNFIKVKEYEKPILPSTMVIQVIDCVTSY